MLLVNNHVKSIFNLPSVNKESFVALRQLLDGLTKHIRALEILEQPVKFWDTLIIHIISNKFDSITRRDWEGKNNNQNKLPSTNELIQFLREKCILLETLSPESIDRKVKSRSFVSNENSNCSLCNGNHSLFQCNNFLKFTPSKRYSVVKSHNLCTNCFKADHKNSDCRSSNCKKCQKRHHTLLHFDNSQGESSVSNSVLNETNLYILKRRIKLLQFIQE